MMAAGRCMRPNTQFLTVLDQSDDDLMDESPQNEVIVGVTTEVYEAMLALLCFVHPGVAAELG